jgi:multidrug efflux pump subunit AcrA (membrane-fusion protein)
MKHKKIIIPLVLVAIIALLWFFLRPSQDVSTTISVPVEKGTFVISIYTSGELEAQNSENIYGPAGLRTVGIWNVSISELIPEGTVVEAGDWVATLDRTEISNRLKDVETELEKLQMLHTQTRLDTTIELRNARDELVNLKYSMEESKLTLEQSQYEPPATIRQAEIALEKMERTYQQSSHNYELRTQQAKAKMQEVTASLSQIQRRHTNMLAVLKEFVITAPKPGMVIYRRTWDGTKVVVGSQVNTWDNIIATLPDFSVMLSKTYVNEIDISKVKTGQKAEVVIDAFPDKLFTGEVMEVANIGEQRPNQDSRVFEVKIRVNETDSIMRPAMTTKNTIITDKIENALFIPIEAIHSVDSINYVFKQDGRITKQQVVAGKRNENKIVILKGLDEGDKVLLTIPSDAESMSLIKLDLSNAEL